MDEKELFTFNEEGIIYYLRLLGFHAPKQVSISNHVKRTLAKYEILDIICISESNVRDTLIVQNCLGGRLRNKGVCLRFSFHSLSK